MEASGKRRHGKEQLRIDEARKWQAKAIGFADRGEGEAVAAMMCLPEAGPRVAAISSRF